MMTLNDQTALINSLIAENPDVRIKDYMRLIGDVRRIELSLCPRQEVLRCRDLEKIKEVAERKPKLQKKYLRTYRINL
jgi:hypothetical protein